MVDDAQDRQIVVATDHLRLVLRRARRPATSRRRPWSPGSGSRLVHACGGRWPAGDPPVLATEPAEVDDLDAVLAGIRARSEQRWSGWVPTMGKNRTLTGVQFKPYTSGGGFDAPTRADARQALPTVPAPAGATRVRVGLFDTRLAPHDRLTGRFLADDDALLGPVAARRPAAVVGGARDVHRRHRSAASAPTAVLDVRTALRPGRPPDGGRPTADEQWTMPLWDFAATGSPTTRTRASR